MLRTSEPSGSRTRYLILGLLAEGPMSGYDIARITRERFRFFWGESYGQIYPELRRLEEEGLAQSSDGGPRGRRQWSATRAGSAELRAWLEAEGASDTARLETLLKAYFSFAAPGSLARILAGFRERLDAEIASLKEMDGQLRSIPDPHRNHGYARMTIELGLATYRAWRDWAERWAGQLP